MIAGAGRWRRGVVVCLWWAAGSLCAPGIAAAQVRGFVDLGMRTFSASKSFEAILGSATGTLFGGGVEVALPQHLFVNVRASRFRSTGERVFVFEGQRFGLGIPTTITVTPIEVSGGYRFERGWGVVPYAGGGVGQHRYEETSSFATDSENVKTSFTGYHVLGGAEFRVMRWLAVAGEGEWATVPNALGGDPNGVSREFGETDLGGATFRARIIIGR